MIDVEILHSIASIGTQILLSHSSGDLLVDAGDGALRDLVKKPYDFGRLRAVLVTHEHPDHIAGLYSIANFLRLLGRRKELVLVTPKPIERIPTLLSSSLLRDTPYRIRYVEMKDREEVALGEFHVKAFAVKHGEMNTLGYSIGESSGYRVVVSGDTEPCEAVRREAKNADLAILEATFEEKQTNYARRYGHMTEGEAQEIGRLAKTYRLIHAIPQDYFSRMKCDELHDT